VVQPLYQAKELCLGNGPYQIASCAGGGGGGVLAIERRNLLPQAFSTSTRYCLPFRSDRETFNVEGNTRPGRVLPVYNDTGCVFLRIKASMIFLGCCHSRRPAQAVSSLCFLRLRCTPVADECRPPSSRINWSVVVTAARIDP